MKFLCISAALVGLMATQPALGGELRGRALADEERCARVIAIARAPDRARAPLRTTKGGGGHGQDETFVCESSDGRTRTLTGSDGQMKELRRMLAGGRFVSAESTVAVEPGSSRDDAVLLPPGKILFKRASRASRGRPDGGRGLAAHEGQKAVLVVRVEDVDGRVHPDPADVVSDKVFGTHGDRVNAKSQLAACSYGKFVVSHDYAVDISEHLSAPGVIEVDIPISLVENGPTDIENAVRRAAEEKLGFDLPGPFDHVMYVLESCHNSCGWAAYAWINSWLSVYVGDNYKYPAVQLHEGHSGGIDGSAYTDHSCIMGNPHFSDDIGVLCWNAAKTFQIANEGSSWYNENESDTIVWNSETASGSQWTGTIVGIADYHNNPNARPVVVKLESGGPIDLFVGFNRKSGINFETKQAQNSVTVVEAGNDGLGYSRSFVKAILAQGDSYTAANWRGSGLDMIVHVREINLDANPAYADVSMSLGIACGNGVCELGETPTNCATDCLGKELTTTFNHDLGSSVGNLFLVKATCDIEITSLYISTLARGDGEVRVYTREGSYAGFEQRTGGWTITYSGLVDQLGAGQSTFLGRFLTNVVVRAGAYQSFYVVADGGLVDSVGSREFTAFASDNCVQFFEGSSTEMEFGQDSTDPRVWNGIIQYDIIQHITESPTGSPTYSPTLSCGNQYCDADEDSASCPSDCIDKELETTYDYDSGSNGNMFVVKSRRDVTITSLAINTMAKGEGAVYTRRGTYSGHERSINGWRLIYDNAATQMKGRGRPTVLDGMESVFVAGGAYQTFYVWAEKRLVYKRGFIEKMPFASDESLIVFEGIGVKDLFGPVVYSPRVWSGSIRYETSAEHDRRAEETDILDNEISYTTDLCVSVIAIAGSPDLEFLDANDEDADPFDDGEIFVCELSSGLTVPIKGTDEQMGELQRLLDEGTLVSAETTVGIADNLIVEDESGAVFLPPGEIILEQRNETERRDRHSRRLATYRGAKPILTVRVIDSEGKKHPNSPTDISDKVFGTDGDVANAKSQLEACSYGELEVTNAYDVDISEHLAAPGVIEVNIPISLRNSGRSAIRAAVIKATQTKLGFTLPGPFQHVMFVLEGCYGSECGWAAYVNSWLSMYQGNNYRHVAVQMHELELLLSSSLNSDQLRMQLVLGHNLNLAGQHFFASASFPSSYFDTQQAHSGGLDGLTYTDHTGFMGNPYYTDDDGAMCFNQAKNFQIARASGGWFSNGYDVAVWNSDRDSNQWSRKLIGIADYENNPDARPIVAKLESGGPKDLFLGFNRARGINRQTDQARDRVTVVEQGGDGLGYSQSFLKAILSPGDPTYTVPNWRGSGEDLKIEVKEINLGANPAYADIAVSFGDPTSEPTRKPTLRPTTMRPSVRPSVRPTPAPTNLPTNRPTMAPSASPTSNQCGNEVCDASEDPSTCPIDCGNELATTFEFNLGSGGAVFAVEAKQRVSISSLVINSNSRGEGAVKVYTREGGYAGKTGSSEGWTLIYDNPAVAHERRGRPTELGDFDQSVQIAKGATRSFYVSSTRGLVYKSGTTEGAPFVEDESLVILEGIGTSETFSNTVHSPRVWGGIIRYQQGDITLAPTSAPVSSFGECGDFVCGIDESSESCPVDCAGRELETTFDFSLGSGGVVFELKAKRDVSVSSLVINAMARGQGEVKVYTRGGSYSGFLQSSDGWTLVYDNPALVHNRRGRPTALGNFDEAVSIRGGNVQSFFVTSSKHMVYQKGKEKGALFAEDESIAIFEGIGTTESFGGEIFSPRVFGGVVGYDAIQTTAAVCGDSVCGIDESSESCPVDCAGRELETTFDFSLGSGGVVFELKAKRDVSVSSLVINAMARGQGAVKVYTRDGSYSGHVQSSDGWTLIYDNPALVHNRRGQPTELGDFDSAVSVDGGSVRSFFVVSSKNVVYQEGTAEGAPFAEDESLVIFEGIGTADRFGRGTFAPRVFGGRVRYEAN
ncbi:hypothetical protein ACHAXT_009828 [Thalassiosira profunda]